jgi:enoyl-CoA hydratase
MMAREFVRVELPEEHIALVIIDRPPVNALSLQLYEEIGDAFDELATNPDVRVVILTAAGERALGAGSDVNEFVSISPEAHEARSAKIRSVFAKILDFPLPVIGAINGAALGGGLALATVCDIRYCAEHAKLGLPEINVGALGGGRHLGRHVPPGKLREMYFTGEPITAAEALRAGLVDKVVPAAELREASLALARKIAAKSPLALRLAKRSLNESEEMGLREGYEHEQQYTGQLRRSEDSQEAARAYLEKRPPRFTGR